MNHLSVSQITKKVGRLNPSHTGFMRRWTHTRSNAGGYVLGHSGGCYKTNRREDQERKVYQEAR